jgi:hypothetical protein
MRIHPPTAGATAARAGMVTDQVKKQNDNFAH